MHLERQGGETRVSWLMPAGQAWHDGVRPGMRVLSINGTSTEADLIDFDGSALHARVVLGPIVRGPMKWSLWTLSAVFAGLGSVVVLRRPDLTAARWLGLFAGFTAIALAVSPSASGVHPAWSLVVEFVSLVGVGATLLPFAVALLSVEKKVWVHIGVGALIVCAYAASVAALPQLYTVPRTALALYLAASILGAILVLAVAGARHPLMQRRRQSRVILLGVLVGTLPFLGLTLLPEALGGRMLFPAHVTVLATGLIPALAAIAITQLQLLEIRRLVHRGMVYALTTTLVLLAVVLLASFATPMIQGATVADARLLLGLWLILGIATFYPLRSGARWFVDRFVYRDTVDPQALIDVFREDVVASQRSDTVRTWLERITDTLKLESLVLFAGPAPERARVGSSAGERAGEILEVVWPDLENRVRGTESQDLVDLPWKAESLLFMPLRVAGEYVGHLLLGPKHAGEVFLPDERRTIALVAPVLALALQKGELAEQLRLVNQRLVDAEEAERARLAADLHDGPLQKAILLGGGVARARIDDQEVARELTLELREVCSRLRPAILDDLGLAPALEWLLEQAAARFGALPSFVLDGVDELERFPIGTELALFRIAQEAINNAMKHGRATALDISLTRVGPLLILTVEDNGIGFASGGSRGLGIPGMHGRAVHLGGTVEIRSVPGVGTCVEARVPWA